MFEWSFTEAVLFDLDGLLLDSERVSRDCWYHAASELGISIVEVYPQLIGKGAVEADRILEGFFGARVSVPALRQRKNELLTQIIETSGIPLKLGALEIIGKARQLGWKTALATGSTKEWATKKLVGHTICRLFDAMVFRDEVVRGKPSPDIFLAAAAKLDVAPQHCVVFEDSIAGMEAAYAAKMRVVVVPDLTRIDGTVSCASALVLESLLEAAALMPDEIVGSQPHVEQIRGR
jgi:HAD superfamily hydrolase (TIGR01509 family)